MFCVTQAETSLKTDKMFEFNIDVTRDVRTNLCNTTFTFSLIYFALSDACRCQVI